MKLEITRKPTSRILLDKNVAGKFLRALEKKGQGIALDPSEIAAVETVDAELANGKRLFIVPQTKNVLSAFFPKREEVQFFLDRVEVIVSGEYFKRWARRLQEMGFTREDARVLSLGTFGTDEQQSFLGVDEVLTFDKPLVTLFEEKQNKIHDKLEAMKRDVQPPYDHAKLPKVKLLAQLLRTKN